MGFGKLLASTIQLLVWLTLSPQAADTKSFGGITILAVSVPHLFGTRRALKALKLDRSDINIIRMVPFGFLPCPYIEKLKWLD